MWFQNDVDVSWWRRRAVYLPLSLRRINTQTVGTRNCIKRDVRKALANKIVTFTFGIHGHGFGYVIDVVIRRHADCSLAICLLFTVWACHRHRLYHFRKISPASLLLRDNYFVITRLSSTLKRFRLNFVLSCRGLRGRHHSQGSSRFLCTIVP